ncbi:MAG TPA: GNAT family N-acyltransferase [Acetobacteraceae bacterium]
MDFADTPEALSEVFRLRYQVYCLERKFEPGENGTETDDFDAMSRHVLLRHRASNEALGTVRLVIPGLRSELPMERVAALPRLRHLPRERIAEVSRFALSKSRRIAGGCLSYLLRLALIRGIVHLSGEIGISYWCALMEPQLLRLLQRSAIYFQQAGGLVEHHGARQPAFVGLAPMLDRVQREQPEVWEFITDNGTLWQQDVVQGKRRGLAA